MSYMLSAATLFAEFDVGKTQTCANEVAVVGREMMKAPMISGRSYWIVMVAVVLWAVVSQVLAARAIWAMIRGVFGAMHPEPQTRARSTKTKRGVAQSVEKGVQAEVYDLDGMTVPGLQALCTRFGLKRSGLRGELVLRVNAELEARSARCAGELQ